MQETQEHRIIISSPLGNVELAEKDGSLTRCQLTNETTENKDSTPLLNKAAVQLTDYFEGKRTTFDLPLSPKGTEFQQKVWNALTKIPYGKTCSYKTLAENTGSPNGYRATGSANGKNPLWIIIPCHRVINENGALGGYAGGLEIKQKLLDLESRNAA